MDDLVTWLRALLDEDEASEWPHRPSCQMLKSVPEGFPFPRFSCDCDAADRWLREVKAKRRIIDYEVQRLRELWARRVEEHRQTFEAWLVDRGFSTILRLLALLCAGRPGYREEWRPA